MLRTELEILTGKLIRGDLTPIVYELIKDSPYLDDIFLYSSIQREDIGDVNEKKVSGHADHDIGRRDMFKVWLSDEVQSITIQGVPRVREAKIPRDSRNAGSRSYHSRSK